MNKDGSCRERFRPEGAPEAAHPLNATTAGKMQDALARFRGVLRQVIAEEGRRALAGFVNHSGGATGSDRAWDVESSRFGAVSKHWYRGCRTPFGNAPMSDADFIESEETVQEAARRMCRSWSRNAQAQDLVRRNWCQAKYADAVYAVGRIQRTAPVQVRGGTGYAVQMALDLGKPVWVFGLDDGRWHDATNGWAEAETPVLIERFAGIGTRGDAMHGRNGARVLPEAAGDAIRNVCERTAALRNPFYGMLAETERRIETLSPERGCNGFLPLLDYLGKRLKSMQNMHYAVGSLHECFLEMAGAS
ncbi:MAG: hypothetical protein K6E40_05775 [Desulfovibrio sp.]|nr:hypothetical protein [Desulfovibrio sp.]